MSIKFGIFAQISIYVWHIFLWRLLVVRHFLVQQQKYPTMYSPFTLIWMIVNDFQVEFFFFQPSKTMEIECL